MFKERMQTVAICALIGLVLAGIAALVMLRDQTPQATQGKPRADLDSSSKAPTGMLHYLAGPGGFVFRYQSGSCAQAGGPQFDLTDDDGWSFRSIRVPQVDDGTGIGASTPTVSSVVSVDLESRHRFVIAGTDDKCRLRTYVTTDAGNNWVQKAFKPDGWYVDPKSGVVYSPHGAANVDCPGIANLTGFSDESAIAYCTDGSLHDSTDGKTWDRSGSTDEVATSVFFENRDDGYAVWPTDSCQSMVYRTSNGGSSWSKRGCVFADRLVPGIGGDDDLLLAGGNGPVWVSDDEGKSWSLPKNPDDDSAIREQATKQARGESASPSESPSPDESPSPEASASESSSP